ncbi:MAG: NUDIX hydrolase [Defluviitaleaceae bacterium]|nr:NUDIX hydrolase [Defluviitaleaceae bacterium]
MDKRDYEVVQSTTVFHGKIVDVVHDTIALPDGRSALREVVRHVDGAAVLPIDKDGNVVLVRQYRHPLGGMALEIPAGTLNKGEAHLECAARELEEEIGYKSDNIRLLTKISPSCGYCDESIYIYLATDLVIGKQNLDEDEFIEVEAYPLDKAVNMVFDGRIVDAKTVVALLAYRLNPHG